VIKGTKLDFYSVASPSPFAHRQITWITIENSMFIGYVTFSFPLFRLTSKKRRKRGLVVPSVACNTTDALWMLFKPLARGEDPTPMLLNENYGLYVMKYEARINIFIYAN
jgi:hypothetical protein